MSLTEYQNRLNHRYESLRESKHSFGNYVYALEHGLSALEREEVFQLLSHEVSRTRKIDPRHWLVWIAAASEIGYEYDGQEYWDSFGSKFLDWNSYGDRNLIRQWFQKFQQNFGGIRPYGRWSKHFPIIAWPISNAIIPRYLQRHFANHLYDLRYSLKHIEQLSLDEIGNYLAETYSGHSSRFENFLQQGALTSRLILALQSEIATTSGPIEKETFDRIVLDFDELGYAGRRLHQVRKALRKIRVISPEESRNNSSDSTASHGVRSHGQEAVRFVARQSADEVWRIGLTFPNLPAMLKKQGLAPDDLSSTRIRFRVRGSGQRWSPARALFSYIEGYEQELLEIPDTGESIFEFDQPSKLTKLVQPRFGGSGPPVLLKRTSESFAHEISGRHVRSDTQYILIVSEEISSEVCRNLCLFEVQTRLTNSVVYAFKTPTLIEAAYIEALEMIGLGYSLVIRVEPVGLSSRWSANLDALTFLDTETPIFKLSSDVEVQEFGVDLGQHTARIPLKNSSEAFIQLPQLSVGDHVLLVRGLGLADNQAFDTEELKLRVEVSKPWINSIQGKAGVAISVEPPGSTLEEVMDGLAEIKLRAPPNRTAVLRTRFYGPNGTQLHEGFLARISTPTKGNEIPNALKKITNEANAERYQQAARIDVQVSLDEFGVEELVFDKEPEPLRWIRVSQNEVRLADDTDPNIVPQVSMFKLDSVDVPQNINYQDARKGIHVPGQGALFFAKHDKQKASAIVSVLGDTLHDLKSLGVNVSLSGQASSAPKLLNSIRRWEQASKFIGPMAFLAKRNAINCIAERLEQVLCGNDWTTAKNRCLSEARKITDLYAEVYYSRGYAAGLFRHIWTMDSSDAADEKEFLRLSQLYKVAKSDDLARLALKLAFAPGSVRNADLPDKDAIKILQEQKALIRGAYFAKLTSDLTPQRRAMAA